MPEPNLIVNAPMVISEVLEGEAVIMNLESGHYFSCQDVGAEIWSLIELGTPESRILDHLVSRYSADPEVMSGATAKFLSTLKKHDLIREGPVTPIRERSEQLIPVTQGKAAFGIPMLKEYSDMEDLLLLDPIHDVDDAGWPMAKPSLEDSG